MSASRHFLGWADELMLFGREIFGPVLVLVPVRNGDEAIAFVKSRYFALLYSEDVRCDCFPQRYTSQYLRLLA